jgi:hypothetical protein
LGLLSWGSSKIAPPPTSAPCVHSRSNRNPTFGLKLPRLRLVPSLPFLTTPTVYAAKYRAGLLHPAAGHGVRHVSSPSPPHWRDDPKAFPLLRNSPHPPRRHFRGSKLGEPFPMAPHPSERSPPRQLGRCHPSKLGSPPSVSLSSLVPDSPSTARVNTLGWGSVPFPRPQGLTAEESVASQRCCHRCLPDAPVGFISNTTTAGQKLIPKVEPQCLRSGSRRTPSLDSGAPSRKKTRRFR